MSSARVVTLEAADGHLVGHAHIPIEVLPPALLVWNHGVYQVRFGFPDVYREVFAWWVES